jgi:hypothetical protein
MANPYKRTSTPKITYVGTYAREVLFRIHLHGEEGLNGLLFRGEISSCLIGQGTEHRMGNVLRGVMLPEDRQKKDFFLMVDKDEIRTFTDHFEVTGYSPDLVA